MTEKFKKGYLQWHCRRGTKELDVMLTKFLDANYEYMTVSELTNFNSLLETQDTVLWNLLIGKEQSENSDIQLLINKISQT